MAGNETCENDTAGTAKLPRIGFVTIGQAPRTDVVPEILGMLEHTPLYEEFGALDGLSDEEIGREAAGPRDDTLYTRLADGRHVVLRADFVEERLQALMRRVDRRGFDLVVLITTGVFRPIHMNTPFVHGQRALEAWVSTLVLGDCQIGVIYPLARQARTAPSYGTSIQNARTAAAAGGTRSLQVAAKRLEAAELILMLSFGHTEAMARRVAHVARRPVVTTRRIVAGMMRLHLGAFAGSAGFGAPTAPTIDGRNLIDRLPPPLRQLTRREEDVLAHVLDGSSNKLIGRALGISHRTVEIHRSRAMAKFGTSSTTELMRWTLMSRGG
jgi:protein AroM